MLFMLYYNCKNKIVFENIDCIKLGKHWKFKRLHTLFNINSDKYGLHSNANKFHKTKIIYMYFQALQKITRNSPTIMCWGGVNI